jgi:hypothetical protein
MSTTDKNWILRSYLDSAHWIEGRSSILVTDTFCVLTSVMDDAQLFLQPQILPPKAHWIRYKKKKTSTSVPTSQRSLPQWQCRTQSKTSMPENIYIRPCIWYVMWNPRSHRGARLDEKISNRIIKLAVRQCGESNRIWVTRTSNNYKILFWM